MYCRDNPIMYVDPSGNFAIFSFLVGLGINALVGAIVGAFSYTLSEVISYVITGEWSWSWAQFAGNVIGGALSFIFPSVSPILIGGLTGFSSTSFSMILQNQFEETNYSVGQIILTSLFNGMIAAGATGISNIIKISGINLGRNSYSAISKQIFTKFYNDTITKITYNTFSKILTYNLIGNIIGALVSGIMNTSGINDKFAKLIGDISWKKGILELLLDL